MLNIKEAMANGMTKEDIMEAMDAAERELKAEAAATGELDTLREDAIFAVLDYVRALGILPADLVITDKDMETLINGIKEAEKEFKAKMEIVNLLRDFSKAKKVKSNAPSSTTIKISDPEDWDDFLKKFTESL